jgi:hypothetical protein
MDIAAARTESESDLYAQVAIELNARLAVLGIGSTGIRPEEFLVVRGEDGARRLFLTDVGHYMVMDEASRAEVLQREGREVVANRLHTARVQVQRLLYAALQGDVTAGWEYVNPKQDETELEGYDDEQTQAIDSRRFAVDDPDDPSLFAKTTSLDRSAGDHWARDEMEISQRVEQVIASPEAQEIVRNAGFASIKVISPLLAVTDPEAGTKTVITPWTTGHMMGEYGGGDARIFALEDDMAVENELISGLSDLLAAHDIDAIDLSVAQLLVNVDSSGGVHLCLVDMEDYQRFAPAGTMQADTQLPPDADWRLSRASLPRQEIIAVADDMLASLHDIVQTWSLHPDSVEYEGSIIRVYEAVVMQNNIPQLYEVTLGYATEQSTEPTYGIVTMAVMQNGGLREIEVEIHKPSKPDGRPEIRYYYDITEAHQRAAINTQAAVRQARQAIENLPPPAPGLHSNT